MHETAVQVPSVREPIDAMQRARWELRAMAGRLRTMEATLVQAYARTLGPNREQARLVRSELASDAQLVGGAEVAFADVLEDPAGTLDARREQLDPRPVELGEVHRIRAHGS